MNKVKRVVEILGLKWQKDVDRSEKFYFIENGLESKYKYFFDKEGLKKDEGGIFVRDIFSCEHLYGLIKGTYQIKKIPWEPEEGVVGYIPLPSDPDLYVSHYFTENDIVCLHWRKEGLMFETQQEAINASKKMLKVIKHDYTSPEDERR